MDEEIRISWVRPKLSAEVRPTRCGCFLGWLGGAWITSSLCHRFLIRAFILFYVLNYLLAVSSFAQISVNPAESVHEFERWSGHDRVPIEEMIVRDREILERVKKVIEAAAEAAAIIAREDHIDPIREWKFIVFRSETLDAYIDKSGVIRISTGALEYLINFRSGEGKLGGIVLHEMGHHYYGDTDRSSGDRHKGDQQIRESRADSFSLRALAVSIWHPYDIIDFWFRFSRDAKEQPSALERALSTHPSPWQRWFECISLVTRLRERRPIPLPDEAPERRRALDITSAQLERQALIYQFLPDNFNELPPEEKITVLYDEVSKRIWKVIEHLGENHHRAPDLTTSLSILRRILFQIFSELPADKLSAAFSKIQQKADSFGKIRKDQKQSWEKFVTDELGQIVFDRTQTSPETAALRLPTSLAQLLEVSARAIGLEIDPSVRAERQRFYAKLENPLQDPHIDELIARGERTRPVYFGQLDKAGLTGLPFFSAPFKPGSSSSSLHSTGITAVQKLFAFYASEASSVGDFNYVVDLYSFTGLPGHAGSLNAMTAMIRHAFERLTLVEATPIVRKIEIVGNMALSESSETTHLGLEYMLAGSILFFGPNVESMQKAVDKEAMRLRSGAITAAEYFQSVGELIGREASFYKAKMFDYETVRWASVVSDRDSPTSRVQRYAQQVTVALVPDHLSEADLERNWFGPPTQALEWLSPRCKNVGELLGRYMAIFPSGHGESTAINNWLSTEAGFAVIDRSNLTNEALTLLRFFAEHSPVEPTGDNKYRVVGSKALTYILSQLPDGQARRDLLFILMRNAQGAISSNESWTTAQGTGAPIRKLGFKRTNRLVVMAILHESYAGHFDSIADAVLERKMESEGYLLTPPSDGGTRNYSEGWLRSIIDWFYILDENGKNFEKLDNREKSAQYLELVDRLATRLYVVLLEASFVPRAIETMLREHFLDHRLDRSRYWLDFNVRLIESVTQPGARDGFSNGLSYLSRLISTIEAANPFNPNDRVDYVRESGTVVADFSRHVVDYGQFEAYLVELHGWVDRTRKKAGDLFAHRGSYGYEVLSNAHQTLISKYRGNNGLSQVYTAEGFFQRLVRGSPENPTSYPSAASDRFFAVEVLPTLAEKPTAEIYRILGGPRRTPISSSSDTTKIRRATGGNGLLDPELRRRAVIAVIDQRFAGETNFDRAMVFVRNLYPAASHDRDLVLEQYSKTRNLTRAQLEAVEASSTGRQVAERDSIAYKLLNSVFTKLEPSERAHLMLWLADLKELNSGDVLFDKLEKALKEAERFLGRKISIPFLKEMYHTDQISPSEREAMLAQLYADEKSIDLDPKAAEEIERAVLRLVRDDRLPIIEQIIKLYLQRADPIERIHFIAYLLSDVSSGADRPELVAKRVLEGIPVLGPKLAQILASLEGLVPDEYRRVFTSFLDRAPSLPKIQCIVLLHRYLGRDPFEVFASIGRELGSASTGIAYQAELKDGRRVVIKIQREAIGYIVEQKIGLFKGILNDLAASPGVNGSYNVAGHILDMVQRTLGWETNYRNEASSIDIMRRNQRHIYFSRRAVEVRYPEVIKELSNEFVIVESEAEGTKLSRYDLINEERIRVGDHEMTFNQFMREIVGMESRVFIRALWNEILRQIFVTGWVDPDRHRGNNFVLPNAIVFIDLGQTFNLEVRDRLNLIELVRAISETTIDRKRVMAVWKTFVMTGGDNDSRAWEKFSREASLSGNGPAEIIVSLFRQSNAGGLVLLDRYLNLFNLFTKLREYNSLAANEGMNEHEMRAMVRRWAAEGYVRAHAVRLWREAGRRLRAVGERVGFVGPRRQAGFIAFGGPRRDRVRGQSVRKGRGEFDEKRQRDREALREERRSGVEPVVSEPGRGDGKASDQPVVEPSESDRRARQRGDSSAPEPAAREGESQELTPAELEALPPVVREWLQQAKEGAVRYELRKFFGHFVEAGVVDRGSVEAFLSNKTFDVGAFTKIMSELIAHEQAEAKKSTGDKARMHRQRVLALRAIVGEAGLIRDLDRAKRLLKREILLLRGTTQRVLTYDPSNPTPRDPMKALHDFAVQHLARGFVSLKIAEGLAKSLRAVTAGDTKHLWMFVGTIFDMHSWLHFSGFVLSQQGVQAVYNVTLGRHIFRHGLVNHSLGKAFSLGGAMMVMDMLTMIAAGQGHLIKKPSFGIKVGANWGGFFGSEMVLNASLAMLHRLVRGGSFARSLKLVTTSAGVISYQTVVFALTFYITELMNEYAVLPWYERELMLDDIESERRELETLMNDDVSHSRRINAVKDLLFSYQNYRAYLTSKVDLAMLGYQDDATLLTEYQSIANASFERGVSNNDDALLAAVLSRASYQAAAAAGNKPAARHYLGTYQDRIRSFPSLGELLENPGIAEEIGMPMLVDAVSSHSQVPEELRTASMENILIPMASRVIDAAGERQKLLSPNILQEKVDELADVYEEQLRLAFEGEWKLSKYRDRVVFDNDPHGARLEALLFGQRRGLLDRIEGDQISAEDWQWMESIAEETDTSFWTAVRLQPDSTTWASLTTYEMADLALLLRDAVELGDGLLAKKIEGEIKKLYLEKGKRRQDMQHLRTSGLGGEGYMDAAMTNLQRMMDMVHYEAFGPFMLPQEESIPVVGGR